MKNYLIGGSVIVLLVMGGMYLGRGADIMSSGVEISSTTERKADVVYTSTASVVGNRTQQISHDGRQLVPQTTTIQAGSIDTISILPEANGRGCMSTIKLPGIDETPKPIIASMPIEFTLQGVQPGVYEFVCNGMGMYQGTLIIEA